MQKVSGNRSTLIESTSNPLSQASVHQLQPQGNVGDKDVERGDSGAEHGSASSSAAAGTTFTMLSPSRNAALHPPGVVVGQVHDWNSQLFDCSRDEESSWWGCWCCWLVAARSVETFELGKSINEVILFWGAIVILVLLFGLEIQPLGLFWGIGCFAYFVWRRANYRFAIRSKYNIPGQFSDDVLLHSACSCCAVCQEAREAKLRLLPRLDYCFADSLAEQELIHERALGRSNSSLAESLVPESGNIFSHLQAVSRTSRAIVVLSAVVCFLSFVLLIASGRGANILILLLVFVQPLVILYYVYWRSRRQYALLDFVIKSFAVGFWFTTFQSVILESILQGVLFIIMMPLMTYGENVDPGRPGPPPMPPSRESVSSGSSGNHGTLGKFIFQLMHGYLSTSTNQEGAYDYVSSSTHLGSYTGMFPNGAPTGSPVEMDDVVQEEYNRQLMKSHFIIVLITLILMAYVVAAGVEETMKHFIVRCCQFPSPLKDPHTVLVYLMAGALGFATCENIEYVFGQHGSPIPGTSMIVGELLVLLMRVLMPIHVICSVLQAANLSKLIIGEQAMTLFQVTAIYPCTG
jgi:Cys-rich protein (TIGR01571 family)